MEHARIYLVLLIALVQRGMKVMEEKMELAVLSLLVNPRGFP